MATKKITKKVEAPKEHKKVPEPTANKFAKTGWITGIISLSTCWTGIIGLITGIVSIVFSAIASHRRVIDDKWLKKAKTGLKLGIAGTVLSAIFTIAWSIVIPYVLWKFIIW